MSFLGLSFVVELTLCKLVALRSSVCFVLSKNSSGSLLKVMIRVPDLVYSAWTAQRSCLSLVVSMLHTVGCRLGSSPAQ